MIKMVIIEKEAKELEDQGRDPMKGGISIILKVIQKMLDNVSKKLIDIDMKDVKGTAGIRMINTNLVGIKTDQEIDIMRDHTVEGARVGVRALNRDIQGKEVNPRTKIDLTNIQSKIRTNNPPEI